MTSILYGNLVEPLH